MTYSQGMSECGSMDGCWGKVQVAFPAGLDRGGWRWPMLEFSRKGKVAHPAGVVASRLPPALSPRLHPLF